MMVFAEEFRKANRYREVFFFGETECEAAGKATNAMDRIVAALAEPQGDGSAFVSYRTKSKFLVAPTHQGWLRLKGFPLDSPSFTARIKLATYPELTEAQWQAACQGGMVGKAHCFRETSK